jgi:hypothetical protein
MTEEAPRLFDTDLAIHRIGEGLLARNLPRPEWTHEAHLAACSWIMIVRPDINPSADMRGIISSYNEAVGGVNDDSQGYHETITQVYIAAVRAHLHERIEGEALWISVNQLLLSPRGKRDLPLQYYSRERLFSVAARREFIEPDLRPLSEI